MGIKSKIIAILSVFALTGSLVFWAHWERSGRQDAESEAQTAQARLAESERARSLEQQAAQTLHQTMTDYHDRLRASHEEIDRLARLHADGAIGLRIEADCPELPADAATASGADDRAPRLTESARRDYFDLRRGIAEERERVIALQEYARQCYELTQSAAPKGD